MTSTEARRGRTFALLLWLTLKRAETFTLPNLPTGSLKASCILQRSLVDPSTTTLFAKSKKSKKSRTTAPKATGGFGRVAAVPRPKQADEDYSVFPALDAHIAQTLMAAPASLQESAGYLPAEIYDRLDQIYGFPNFNYEEMAVEDEETNGQMSLGELLAAPSEPAKTTSSKSSMTDMDFADLLSAATGGKVDSSSVSSLANNENEDAVSMTATNLRKDLSKLPPFEQFRVLHVDPLVLAIDDFFTHDECDRYVGLSLSSIDDKGPQIESFQTRSRTVGKDESAKSQRTSTTWFHHYKNVPELMAKASRLVGLDTIAQWEEPQTVRYRPSEKFTWHLDALAPPQATADQGGQRLATLLVYLKDLEEGGATIFRDLKGLDGGPLKVQPKKGSALMFFPAAGGIPNTPFDIRTLHCGESVAKSSDSDKWISQLWLRENTAYKPSAPPGNLHQEADEAVQSYCERAKAA